MSATDELRRLLDERGVEYEAYRDIKNRCITRWRAYHGAFAFFAVEKEGELFVETASDTEHSAICTPEQAIAATLGGEECEMAEAEIEDMCGEHLVLLTEWTCSECGHASTSLYSDERPKFCKECGAKVKAVKR